MCARVFAFGQQEALRRGLILVDTKYEIGRRPDGTLCFIDEIHTPDSSRYWYADDYEARFARGEEPRGLDKEYVRRTLADQGYRGDGPPPTLADDVRVEAARRYIQVCELITGRPFVPDTEEPSARIREEPEARVGRGPRAASPLPNPLPASRGEGQIRSGSSPLPACGEKVRMRGRRFSGSSGLSRAGGRRRRPGGRRRSAAAGGVQRQKQPRQLGQRLRDGHRLDRLRA